jgi:tRNA threonylcarbamoyl adenosine modification protein YeaZ
MRLLAIDTALAACSAAVYDAGSRELLALESLEMVRGHAEALLPLVARVMQAAQSRFVDLQRVAVTTGPGSFTGLRVGISAARAIALASGFPAIGVTTLEAYAAPYFDLEEGAVAVAIDARHRHVYLQVFGADGRTLVAPQVASLAEAVAAARGAARVIGSGAPLIAAAWPPGEPPPAFDPREAPDIGWVARLGAAAEKSSAPPKPLYLRAPDARPQHAAWIARR